MKRLFLIMGFILMLLISCSNTNAKVTISADRDAYSPLMSSARGITLTAKFESKKNYEKLVYHWITDQGEFIDFGKEVENQGEAIVWSAIENDKVADIKKTVDIKLEIIDGKSKKVLAATGLTITPNNGLYKVTK